MRALFRKACPRCPPCSVTAGRQQQHQHHHHQRRASNHRNFPQECRQISLSYMILTRNGWSWPEDANYVSKYLILRLFQPFNPRSMSAMSTADTEFTYYY